jgi:hypothetical protein
VAPARADLLARLRRGERLLLDGATGSELQRRGVDVSRGSTVEGGLGVWSGPALEGINLLGDRLRQR